MQLNELIEGLAITLQDPALASLRICDLSEDSRTTLPNSLFVARPGSQTNGAGFIGEAIRAGAEAILTDSSIAGRPCPPEVAWLTTPNVPRALAELGERFFGHPSRMLRLVGITGTNGKSTVAALVQQLLDQPIARCGLLGTVSVIDGRGTARASMTTPPALELSYSLSTMIEAGFERAAIEVSSHALEQERVAGLEFDAAVFTNLSGEHQDYHGSMSAYARAKSKLFEMLDGDARAVINADDPMAQPIAGEFAGRIERCTIADAPGATCRARFAPWDLDGTPVELEGPWGTVSGRSPLLGEFNVMNLLLSVAAAHAIGASARTIERRLPTLRAPEGRLERVDAADTGAAGPVVFVDYAHTDDALDQVLRSLRPVADARRTRLHVVMGCGGDRDRSKRPRMGMVASRWGDVVYVTSDNPRTESPDAIISEVLRGVESPGGKVVAEVDRGRAIEQALRTARDGEIVVIAGKGHEDYQLLPDRADVATGRVGVRRIAFDDRAVARDALAGRTVEEVRP